MFLIAEQQTDAAILDTRINDIVVIYCKYLTTCT